MKKKVGILLSILIAMFMLVGWGKKEVKLLGGSKLIDLNKAIELAKPGGSAGDSEEDFESLSENTTVEEEETQTGENHTDQDSIDAVAKDISIRIRNNQIYYRCGNEKEDRIADAELEKRISSDYGNKAQVTLYDDYAEAHEYRNVREVLDKLRNGISLTYKEEPYSEGE